MEVTGRDTSLERRRVRRKDRTGTMCSGRVLDIRGRRGHVR